MYAVKSKIAESTQTPKLVLIAGSNSLFGISCKTIYKKTQVPCVNGGTDAGLGITYMLYRARSLVKPGDTIILPLEYTHYKSNNVPTNILVDYVIEQEPEYLLSTDFPHSIRIISGISLKKILKGFLYKFRPSTPISRFYDSKTINDFGDETNNLKSNLTKKQLYDIGRLKPDPNIVGYIKDSHGLQKIKEFISWCKINDIKVIGTWPNTIWFDVYKKQEQQDFFQSIKDFYKATKTPIIGKPEDFMFDKSMFYDTRYHLNDLGMRQATQIFIDLFEPYLKNIKNDQ